MFDNIINLNNYLNIKEDFSGFFSGGNDTTINANTKIKKSFENNTKINSSMLVDSITKLVNNVSSDVVQKNSTSAASAVGSSNTLSFSDIDCDEINLSAIRQTAEASSTTHVQASQSNMSKISNEISSTIDKTIEKVGGTDLAAFEAANTKQLNDYMQATPGYDPDAALKLSGGCPGGESGFTFISVKNKCDVNSSYELDGTVK